MLPEGAATNLTASVLAGLTACLASNPIDVIKTRLMVQRRSDEFLDLRFQVFWFPKKIPSPWKLYALVNLHLSKIIYLRL